VFQLAPTHPTSGDLPAHITDELGKVGLYSDRCLVVAVSGGLDSCVLLDGLIRARGSRGIHIAHLDHQLRKDSAQDADFVAALSAHHRLPCTIARAHVGERARRTKESVEMAARFCRRAFLRRIGERINAPWILLAHHADDQAETVLLRLLRGSGGTGLAGMSPARDGLLRPLLKFTRDDLRSYALDRGLDWREDQTNHDIRPRRNRIRHQLLPLLRQAHNPKVVSAIGRAAHLLGDEDDYLAQVAQKALDDALVNRTAGKVMLESRQLAGYHIAIQRRVLLQVIQEVAATETVTSESVEQLLKVLHAGSNTVRDLGYGLRCQCTQQTLILRGAPKAPWLMPLQCPARMQLPGQILESRWCPAADYAQLRATLDLDQVILDATPSLGELVLRSPRRGDRLRPLGLSGHSKKLSDCFIDARWPRILREDAVVLSRAEDDEILWVAGLARSECFQVNDSSRSLIHLRPIEESMVSHDDES
jgi:tRNA(Ile)-lysidine synthase